MEATISKSQIEVWEWKERAYEEIKEIPKDKRVEFIFKSVEKTIESLKMKQKEKFSLSLSDSI